MTENIQVGVKINTSFYNIETVFRTPRTRFPLRSAIRILVSRRTRLVHNRQFDRGRIFGDHQPRNRFVYGKRWFFFYRKLFYTKI